MDIEVMLACNDSGNGLFSGRLHAIQIADKIRLSSYFIPTRTSISFIFTGGNEDIITIGRKCYTFREHNEWVGNWSWDSIIVDEQTAARILNDLQFSGAWTCEEAESDLFMRWRMRWPISHLDLR